MTVSARHSAPAFIVHDACYHREFPYAFTTADPGVGSGAAGSIAVETATDTYSLAWRSYGTSDSVAAGTYPPAGYSAQPSASALQNAIRWWPQGFHHYQGVSWSRNFGFIANNVSGIGPSGDVIPGNWCYPWIPNATRKWQFLSYSSIEPGQGHNPYYNNANAWWQHIGYDIARRKDLVIVEETASGGSDFLSVYETSSGIPCTRGSKVWQGTNGDRTLGRTFKTEGGQQRIQIPWLGQWWVIQYSQSASALDQVWGFSPTSSPASTSSSTAAGFAITVPSAVRTVAQAKGGNIHFVVDQMNQRVFAYQADSSQTAQVIGGVAKYPLLIWEVNPSTYVWTSVQLASQLLVALGDSGVESGKINLAPMAYFGGSQFLYLDQRNSGGISYGDDLSISGNPLPAQTKKTGGLYVRELFIPKASPPRSMVWTARNYSATAITGELYLMKHSEMTFNSSDGKIYMFGGDHGLMGDTTLPQGSYNNQVISFTPETGTDFALLESACPLTGATSHPIRVDENGFQYRATSNDFWMMVGYSDANWTNNCGWSTRAAWEAAGGGNFGKVWKWTDAGGWTNAGGFVAKTGFTGRVWSQSEESCRRWYYDSGADKMLAAAYSYGDDGGLQTQTIQILDCTPTGGNYEFSKYRADECFNGLGGDRSLTPDGRPINDTVVGAIGMWRGDRAAVDPSTGYVYVYQPATGDVYRIHTRANFYTGAGGFPAARVDWVCRAIASHTRSYNLAHFIWAKNALWMFFQSAMGRIRAFSWADGESSPTEHLPVDSGGARVYPVAGAACKYTVGGDDRICLMGNQTQSSWSSIYQSTLTKYWTVTLS